MRSKFILETGLGERDARRYFVLAYAELRFFGFANKSILTLSSEKFKTQVIKNHLTHRRKK